MCTSLMTLYHVILFKLEEINECDDQKVCGDNAVCFNTPGSYYCQCREGFENKYGAKNFTAVKGHCLGESLKGLQTYLTVDVEVSLNSSFTGFCQI